MISYVIDPFPDRENLSALWRSAWGGDPQFDFEKVLMRSLVHLGAFSSDRLIGFVNVAWDGGVHAFLLDTCVSPDFRRQGVGQALVQKAIAQAQLRGAAWLHVDFELQYKSFYTACGFAPTEAGLIALK